MRLRLFIQRHSLPSVQIVYTTGTGPASHTKSPDSTIADLLLDVNDLVPLESADGEWGLEDYVVEVVPAADPTAAYECLHFQTCETVLREDDEVVIRALSSEELRIRRLGGRHQISADGKHLIDGVTFGKQWLRKGSRPGIVIPPRKRRRLLSAEPAADYDDDEVRQLLPPPEGYLTALVAVTGDDEDEDDEEEDEDYVDNPLQVAVRADFDDADAGSDDASEISDGALQEADLSAEVRLLLEDAADIEKSGNSTAAQKLVRKQLKRKRGPDDEGEEQESATFEGFSTPLKAPKHMRISDEIESTTDSDADSMLQTIAVEQAEKRAKNLILEEEDEEDDEDFDEDIEDSSDSDASSNSESSFGSGTDSEMEKLAVEQAKKRALNLIRATEDSSSDDETASDYASETSGLETVDEATSSSGSDSGSDSDADSDSDSNSDSDSASDSDSDSNSDSDDDSDSDSDVSSSSSDSDSESNSVVVKVKQETKKGATSTPGTSTTLQHPTPGSEGPAKPSTVPPGAGTARTHNNNSRAKKRKRLIFLKEQGILPKDADFHALAAYEAAQENKTGAQPSSEEPGQSAAAGQTAEYNVEKQKTVGVKAVNGASKIGSETKTAGNSTSALDAVVAPSAEVSETVQAEPLPDVEPTPKRARLDVASTRRMVFTSLGLRTPKTPEAEQALREKLSKSIRPAKQPSSSSAEAALPLPPNEAQAEHEDAWKEKLIIAAVECEQQGVVLTPPPFPFQQGWTKASSDNPTRSKRRARDQAQYYDDNQGQLQEDQQDGFAPDVSTLGSGDPHQPDDVDSSKLTPNGTADIPIPTDFETLPHLDQASILPGVVVAYKELHVDASTNYQPEISSFRVGRVAKVDEDGNVFLTLAKRSLESASKKKYDEKTGERVYGKFELLSEDADELSDDGFREILFSSMISPKLVEPSSVEVPNSNQSSGLRGGDGSDSNLDDQYAAILETVQNIRDLDASNPTHVSVDDIATPRRKEISDMIKDAGFNSALDEQLLPVSVPSDEPQLSGSTGNLQDQSQEEYPHRFRKDSPRVKLTHSADGTSCELDESANVDARAPRHLESELTQSSPPIIHTQETVEYPHISQIEINSSGPLLTVKSSSHQDAQHISPVHGVELSFTASDQQDWVNEADHDSQGDSNRPQDSFEPLESQVPPSQSQEGGQDESPGRRDSFLGVPGYDGQDSSYHDDDAASEDDSDDLPSIQEITSGHRQSKSLRLRPGNEIRQPTRKSPRQAQKVRSSTPPSSLDLPPSSQPVIKLSQSQQEPRLSQIPAGSQVIDLTGSSSPQKQDDEESRTGIGRRKCSSQANGTKKPAPKATKDENGVGKRRLLTTKKARSYW
ncbi:hypothetical protein A1O3_04202 [Capronia epimyces CBS 606.96]|uniref:Uncharacterized protein n=1 Tax=Capronia epimyces CBS 606.96 TaxID=1182542 RepID=W9Y3Z8_9EURO|nr:uncharacterized protein A1O3_04202 [Capronia epimyces CBS 606.96]EXJ87243.1 hypothetical protein A1O3_04202 [Capronia epimyces CBS 606.96]